jgi:hypothetical protein
MARATVAFTFFFIKKTGEPENGFHSALSPTFGPLSFYFLLAHYFNDHCYHDEDSLRLSLLCGSLFFVNLIVGP